MKAATSREKEKGKKRRQGDFPGGTVDKDVSANAGDVGSIPGLGRFRMPRSNKTWTPQLLSPCPQGTLAVITEPACSRV